jgi:hypothetical protein
VTKTTGFVRETPVSVAETAVSVTNTAVSAVKERQFEVKWHSRGQKHQKRGFLKPAIAAPLTDAICFALAAGFSGPVLLLWRGVANLRMGSTVLCRDLGTSTIGQPS